MPDYPDAHDIQPQDPATAEFYKNMDPALAAQLQTHFAQDYAESGEDGKAAVSRLMKHLYPHMAPNAALGDYARNNPTRRLTGSVSASQFSPGGVGPDADAILKMQGSLPSQFHAALKDKVGGR